jgi:hypothetical protein
LSGEELVEGHAKSPNVGADIGTCSSTELFRGHVPERADEGAGLRESFGLVALEGFEKLGDAKVEDFDGGASAGSSPCCKKEVGGLDVAMDDAGGVGFGKGCAGLEDMVDGFGGGKAASFEEDSAEVSPFEALEHDVGGGADDVGVEDPANVRAAEAGHGASLACEAGAGDLVEHDCDAERFYGNTVTEDKMRGGVDDAHPAASEEPLDAVFSSEGLTDREDFHCAW